MFTYKNNILHSGGLPLPALAKKFGTPLYVYSRAQLDANIRAVKGAFEASCPEGLICYAVKANSHLALLKYLASQGFGFDIVSHGEMLRVLKAQGHLNNVVYSGSAKSASDIYEAVKNKVFMLNVESLWEIRQASKAAASLNTMVSLCLRVNPSVDPRTHKYISTGLKGAKFGIPKEDILPFAQEAASLPGIKLEGLSCHIGSMVADEAPFLEMLEVLSSLAQELHRNGLALRFIDLGGGYPITYTTEKEVNYSALFTAYQKTLKPLGLRPIIEPGRAIIGNAGLLLAEVVHIKESFGQRFAFLNAGFTELIRPALYGAQHKILPLELGLPPVSCTVAGPVCESTDLFAENISLAVQEGSFVAFENAGAYGASMASNYNTRPKCAEVFISGGEALLITKAEGIPQLWENEKELAL